MQPRDGCDPGGAPAVSTVCHVVTVGQHEVRAVRARSARWRSCSATSRARGARGAEQLDERGAREGAMDGPEEQGSVVLVDEHGQAGVPRRTGVLLLQAQVGGVPVVAVGEEAARRREKLGDPCEGLGLADGPDALALTGAVEVAPVRVAPPTTDVTISRSCGRPWWTSRIGAGLRSICSIRSASSPACSGWIASCGHTARSVEGLGATRHRQRARRGRVRSGRRPCTRGGRSRVRCRRWRDPARSTAPDGSRRRDRVAPALGPTRDPRPARAPASPHGRAGAREAPRRTAARRWRVPSEHRRGTLVTARRGVQHARGVQDSDRGLARPGDVRPRRRGLRRDRCHRGRRREGGTDPCQRSARRVRDQQCRPHPRPGVGEAASGWGSMRSRPTW